VERAALYHDPSGFLKREFMKFLNREGAGALFLLECLNRILSG
jgi:hypothetical protein